MAAFTQDLFGNEMLIMREGDDSSSPPTSVPYQGRTSQIMVSQVYHIRDSFIITRRGHADLEVGVVGGLVERRLEKLPPVHKV